MRKGRRCDEEAEEGGMRGSRREGEGRRGVVEHVCWEVIHGARRNQRQESIPSVQIGRGMRPIPFDFARTLGPELERRHSRQLVNTCGGIKSKQQRSWHNLYGEDRCLSLISPCISPTQCEIKESEQRSGANWTAIALGSQLCLRWLQV